MRQLYEIQPRHELRDGSGKFWPERAIARDPAINAAEVERALSRPPRSKCTAPRTARAAWPANLGEPPIQNGRRLTYASAGVILGISPAAVHKRVARHGWTKAMTMGAPLTNKH
jgi:hypothetical protein